MLNRLLMSSIAAQVGFGPKKAAPDSLVTKKIDGIRATSKKNRHRGQRGGEVGKTASEVVDHAEASREVLSLHTCAGLGVGASETGRCCFVNDLATLYSVWFVMIINGRVVSKRVY